MSYEKLIKDLIEITKVEHLHYAERRRWALQVLEEYIDDEVVSEILENFI